MWIPSWWNDPDPQSFYWVAVCLIIILFALYAGLRGHREILEMKAKMTPQEFSNWEREMQARIDREPDVF